VWEDAALIAERVSSAGYAGKDRGTQPSGGGRPGVTPMELGAMQGAPEVAALAYTQGGSSGGAGNPTPGKGGLTCHYCKHKGHIKKECRKYAAFMAKNKGQDGPKN
jgi:hypothetical protein